MAASREPVILTIGGVGFKVRPLTVTQIEAIEGILAKPPKSNTRQASEIVAAGLSRDHADLDIEDAGATITELGSAAQALLRLGGFDPTGEAPGAPANAVPTGATSADVSAPSLRKRRMK